MDVSALLVRSLGPVLRRVFDASTEEMMEACRDNTDRFMGNMYRSAAWWSVALVFVVGALITVVIGTESGVDWVTDGSAEFLGLGGAATALGMLYGLRAAVPWYSLRLAKAIDVALRPRTLDIVVVIAGYLALRFGVPVKF